MRCDDGQDMSDAPRGEAPCEVLVVELLRRRLDGATALPAVLEVMANTKVLKDRRGDPRRAALAGALWIEAMVRADQQIAAMRKRGELARHGGPRGAQHTSGKVAVRNLAALEINRVEAFRWHQVAEIEPQSREAYLRECLASGRRVGVRGLLRFAARRSISSAARDEAHARLRATITSALRGLDRSLHLAPDQAVELRGCRDRLKRQLEAVSLLDLIDDAAQPGSDLVTPFEALLSGTIVGAPQAAGVEPLLVLAVLERTAVVCPVGYQAPSAGDRALVRLSELFVDPAATRWKAAGQELRFGFDGKVSPRACRRCPRCGRREGETEFRAYRTSYCIECAREVVREHHRRHTARVGEAA